MATDDMEQLLMQYIDASRKAEKHYSGISGLNISPPDIQNALGEIFQIPAGSRINVVDLKLTSEKMIECLRNFNFKKYHPEVLAEIHFDDSIIPDECTSILTEKTVKAGGEVWRIHKNDVDPFPSNPHGHNLETGLVLHLGSGELFDKRKCLGNIGCKNLLLIRSKLTSLTLPTTHCI